MDAIGAIVAALQSRTEYLLRKLDDVLQRLRFAEQRIREFGDGAGLGTAVGAGTGATYSVVARIPSGQAVSKMVTNTPGFLINQAILQTFNGSTYSDTTGPTYVALLNNTEKIINGPTYVTAVPYNAAGWYVVVTTFSCNDLT